MSASQRNTYLYLFTQFLYALVFTIPIWIVYYQGRISVTQISFLVAFQYAMQLLLEMPTGALADLVGRKICVAFGYGFWALSFLIIIFSQNFTGLLIATFFGGLAESLLSGSMEALMYDSLKQEGKENEFVKVSAQNNILFQIALAVATLSGGFLYQVHESLPYFACAVANALAFVLSFWFVEPLIDSEKFNLSNYVKQIKDGAIHAFNNEKTTITSLFYILVSAITWTNNLYFFDFMLVELGLSEIHRSIVGSVIRLINITLIALLIKNDRIFTTKRSIQFFPLMMIVCFLPGIFYSGLWALPLVAGAVLIGTARWVILARYTNELFESKYRATAISTLSMIVGILFVIITTASGPIIENFGGVRTMYTLLGITSVLTVLPLSVRVLRIYRG